MKRRTAVLTMTLCMTLLLTGCKKEIPVEEAPVETTTSTAEETQPVEEIQQAAETELTPEEGAELKFWTTDVEFGKAAGAAFEEQYGVSVTVEEAGLDAINKIMLDGPAGNGADLFMVAHDSFQLGYSAGVFQEIDASIAAELNSEVNEVALKTVARDGKMYGVPVSIETSALFYNKDLVQEPAESFEQIMEEAKAWNNPHENRFWFLFVATDGYAAYPFMTPFGFQLFGADGLSDVPGFDTPAFLDALKNYATIKEAMPIDADNLKMDTATFLEQNFIDAKTAYYPVGPWVAKNFKDAGVNYGVCKLPTLNGKPMQPFAGVQNVHVSAYSKYPIAAQLFAQFLVSEEGAGLLYEKASKITARKDVNAVPGLCEDEDLLVFADQFSDAVPMPASKRMSYYWTISNSVFTSVFDGTLTPEQGAQKAQEDFDALVASE